MENLLSNVVLKKLNGDINAQALIAKNDSAYRLYLSHYRYALLQFLRTSLHLFIRSTKLGFVVDGSRELIQYPQRRAVVTQAPMHFWIDKRSQCAYSGRHRVPSSLSAGVGRARGRKGMAAPVHRFAAVECAPRRPHRPMRHYAPPPIPAVHSTRRQNEEPSLYVEIPPEPPQPTIASLAAARSVTPDTLLRTAALGLHNSPMMAPHLKFGMLVSLALATVFLAGAKYYFDRQVVRAGVSSEAGVVCAAVACVCGLGCALSLCRTRPHSAPAPPDRVSSTAQRHAHQIAAVAEELPALLPASERSERRAERLTERPVDRILERAPDREVERASTEAPPPYHIAVLLPGRVAAPPPAYSALS